MKGKKGSDCCPSLRQCNVPQGSDNNHYSLSQDFIIHCCHVHQYNEIV